MLRVSMGRSAHTHTHTLTPATTWCLPPPYLVDCPGLKKIKHLMNTDDECAASMHDETSYAQLQNNLVDAQEKTNKSSTRQIKN
jgi:hypothetical protein